MTQPKNKLYLATVPSYTVMYLATEETTEQAAKIFARQELETNSRSRNMTTKIKEISTKQQVPKEWREHALIWGCDAEITALQFLDGWLDEEEEEIDPDWEEFKRLKKKFGYNA